MVRINWWISKMVNTVWVNANNGSDLHPLANHMAKLRNFTKNKIVIFQHFDLHFSKCLNKHYN